jgi:hypothetical protein
MSLRMDGFFALREALEMGVPLPIGSAIAKAQLHNISLRRSAALDENNIRVLPRIVGQGDKSGPDKAGYDNAIRFEF